MIFTGEFLSQSQRAVKVKLQVLEKEAQKKFEREKEERERLEKQNKKLLEKDTKQQQRLEVKFSVPVWNILLRSVIP